MASHIASHTLHARPPDACVALFRGDFVRATGMNGPNVASANDFASVAFRCDWVAFRAAEGSRLDHDMVASGRALLPSEWNINRRYLSKRLCSRTQRVVAAAFTRSDRASRTHRMSGATLLAKASE